MISVLPSIFLTLIFAFIPNVSSASEHSECVESGLVESQALAYAWKRLLGDERSVVTKDPGDMAVLRVTEVERRPDFDSGKSIVYQIKFEFRKNNRKLPFTNNHLGNGGFFMAAEYDPGTETCKVLATSQDSQVLR